MQARLLTAAAASRRLRAPPAPSHRTPAPHAAQDAGSGTSEDSDSEDGGDGSDSDMGEEEDEAAAVARARAVAASMRSSRGESGAPTAGGDHLAAALAELDMDHYDSEGEGPTVFGGSGNPGGAFFRDPTADPLLRGGGGSDSEDGDSEAEAWRLRPDDLLVLAARNEDDVSHLEVGEARQQAQHRGRSAAGREGVEVCVQSTAPAPRHASPR